MILVDRHERCKKIELFPEEWRNLREEMEVTNEIKYNCSGL